MAAELAGPHEVIQALGLANRSSLKYLRDRYPSFPKPVARLAIGDVWDLGEIMEWDRVRKLQMSNEGGTDQ